MPYLHSYSARPWRLAMNVIAGVVVSLIAINTMVATAPAQAARRNGASNSLRMNVLVISDGQPMVQAIWQRLKAEGVPTTVVDLKDSNRKPIDSGFLITEKDRRKRGEYSGVVIPSVQPAGLKAEERSALDDYENQFRIREVAAFVYPTPATGSIYLTPSEYQGSVDGMKAQVTKEGLSGPFNYLKGDFSFDDLSPTVVESYGYAARPIATSANESFTPLVTVQPASMPAPGSLLGVHKKGNQERMIITVGMNAGQQHWRILGHGVVNWVTRGVSLSYFRNWYSVHVDDILLPDARWSIAGKCTMGGDCDPAAHPAAGEKASIRTSVEDINKLVTWQKEHDFVLDLAFNGNGRELALKASGQKTDPVTEAVVANKSEFRFLNHTWSHLFFGCVRELQGMNWSCKKDAQGNTLYVTEDDIRTEIVRNREFARSYGMELFDSELVTGEHSGLRLGSIQPDDNPNLIKAMHRLNVAYTAADASRESAARLIGSTWTVPRYPVNVYFNTATTSEAASEYNWIYAAAADGGSGLCEKMKFQCAKPVDLATGFEKVITPEEVTQTLLRITNNDPRPHYAHQGNLAEDGLLYKPVEQALAQYRKIYADNTPIVNPALRAAGKQLVDQQLWSTSSEKITAVLDNEKLEVTNDSRDLINVPVTIPQSKDNGNAAVSDKYAGQRSGWLTLGSGDRQRCYVGDIGFNLDGSTAPKPSKSTVPMPLPSEVPTSMVPVPTPTTVLPSTSAPSVSPVDPTPTGPVQSTDPVPSVTRMPTADRQLQSHDPRRTSDQKPAGWLPTQVIEPRFKNDWPQYLAILDQNLSIPVRK